MCFEDTELLPVRQMTQALDLHLPFISVGQYEAKVIFLSLKLSFLNDPCLVSTLLLERSDNFYNSFENTSFLLFYNNHNIHMYKQYSHLQTIFTCISNINI
jgi:hypothetical protein